MERFGIPVDTFWYVQDRVEAFTSQEAIDKMLSSCIASGWVPVDVVALKRLNLGEWEGIVEIEEPREVVE